MTGLGFIFGYCMVGWLIEFIRIIMTVPWTTLPCPMGLLAIKSFVQQVGG